MVRASNEVCPRTQPLFWSSAANRCTAQPSPVRAPRTLFVAIAGEDGGNVPLGEQGEICVAGRAVFAGYLNDDGADQASFRNGWFRTGDLGLMDRDGYLHITRSRLGHVHIRWLQRLPREIEEKSLQHPAVSEVAVLGCRTRAGARSVSRCAPLPPDDRWRSRSCAPGSSRRWFATRSPRSSSCGTPCPSGLRQECQAHHQEDARRTDPGSGLSGRAMTHPERDPAVAPRPPLARAIASVPTEVGIVRSERPPVQSCST